MIIVRAKIAFPKPEFIVLIFPAMSIYIRSCDVIYQYFSHSRSSAEKIYHWQKTAKKHWYQWHANEI